MANLDASLKSPGYKKYASEIAAVAKSVSGMTGVPEDFLRSAVTALAARESNFNPSAKGKKLEDGTHALGIMQYRPSTAKLTGLNPLDPRASFMQGAKDVAEAFKRGGAAEVAASHFAGPGGAGRGPKTRDYVRGFLDDMAQLGSPAHKYAPARATSKSRAAAPIQVDDGADPFAAIMANAEPVAPAPAEVNPFETTPMSAAPAADPMAQYQEPEMAAPAAPKLARMDLNPFGGFDVKRDQSTLKFFEQQIENAHG